MKVWALPYGSGSFLKFLKLFFMDNTGGYTEVKHGTAGGLLILLFANISGAELVRTVIITGTGCIVSVLVSVAMKWLLDKLK